MRNYFGYHLAFTNKIDLNFPSYFGIINMVSDGYNSEYIQLIMSTNGIILRVRILTRLAAVEHDIKQGVFRSHPFPRNFFLSKSLT